MKQEPKSTLTAANHTKFSKGTAEVSHHILVELCTAWWDKSLSVLIGFSSFPSAVNYRVKLDLKHKSQYSIQVAWDHASTGRVHLGNKGVFIFSTAREASPSEQVYLPFFQEWGQEGTNSSNNKRYRGGGGERELSRVSSKCLEWKQVFTQVVLYIGKEAFSKSHHLLKCC